MISTGPVLVTGAGGFTGKYLVSYLANLGFDVESVSLAFEDRGIDLRDQDSLDTFLAETQPANIIHLAGVSNPMHSKPEDFDAVNTRGTVNLLESARHHVKDFNSFIFASTAAVYAANKDAIDEGSEVNAQSRYAQSKLEAERRILRYSDEVRVVIARPFNYTGVGQASEFVIPKLVDAYRNRFESLSVGNLSVFRDFSDVRDIVRYYGVILTSGRSGEIYNLCSGESIQLWDIAGRLENLAGHRVALHEDSALRRRADNPVVLGSNNKIKQEFGLSAEHSLDRTLEWMLSIEQDK